MLRKAPAGKATEKDAVTVSQIARMESDASPAWNTHHGFASQVKAAMAHFRFSCEGTHVDRELPDSKVHEHKSSSSQARHYQQLGHQRSTDIRGLNCANNCMLCMEPPGRSPCAVKKLCRFVHLSLTARDSRHQHQDALPEANLNTLPGLLPVGHLWEAQFRKLSIGIMKMLIISHQGTASRLACLDNLLPVLGRDIHYPGTNQLSSTRDCCTFQPSGPGNGSLATIAQVFARPKAC